MLISSKTQSNWCDWIWQDGVGFLHYLGEIKLVKATLKAFPELKKYGGPQGLTLKHHAQKGGERAKSALKYFGG